MFLDASNEGLSNWEGGATRRFVMETARDAGDAGGADSLVAINSANVPAQPSSLYDMGADVLERFADSGGKFSVPTSVDPANIDLQNWMIFGVIEKCAGQQFRFCDACAKLGGMRCGTHIQYLICSASKQGGVVAWMGAQLGDVRA